MVTAATIQEMQQQADPKDHPKAVEYENLLGSIEKASYKVTFWESVLTGKGSKEDNKKTPLVLELEKWSSEADELWGKMRHTKRKAAELVEANDMLLAFDKVLERLDNIISDSKEVLRSLKQQKFTMEQNYPNILIAAGFPVEKPADTPATLPLDLPTPAEAEYQQSAQVVSVVRVHEESQVIQAYQEGHAAYEKNIAFESNPYKPRAERELNLSWGDGWEHAKNGIDMHPVGVVAVQESEDSDEEGNAQGDDPNIEAPEGQAYQYNDVSLGDVELYVALTDDKKKYAVFMWQPDEQLRHAFVELSACETFEEAQATLDKYASGLRLEQA